MTERLGAFCRQSLYVIICFIVLLCLIFSSIRTYYFLRKRYQKNRKTVIAFFHPFCNSGGGGERVLWCALRAISSLKVETPLHVVIYMAENNSFSSHDILKAAKDRFDLELPADFDIQFLSVKYGFLLEPSSYPIFTVLGQSLGSMLFMLLGLLRYNTFPDIFIDTTGFAFTFPVMKCLTGCKVMAYIHYPTISDDMFLHIKKTSSNRIKSYLKTVYYRFFVLFYKLMSYFTDCIMVNSTWTLNHILKLWKKNSSTFLLYPPCAIQRFNEIPFNSNSRENLILSIAQFRPEKDHFLQLYSFKKLITNSKLLIDKKNLRLLLIGSCRNEEDEKRLDTLKELTKKLNLQDNVDFLVNISFNKLNELLKKAKIGIHTMRDEHFGIGIVEMMSAGVVVIAHNSGGPKEDIVYTKEEKRNGFLAITEDEYSEFMMQILYENPKKLLEIQERARNDCKRFSDEAFSRQFTALLEKQLETKQKNH